MDLVFLMTLCYNGVRQKIMKRGIKMKIGIIGTGTIASAIVTGFCTQQTGHEFYVSPRNAEKAAELAAKFSEVTVCSSNQDVLGRADWIFITVQKNGFDAVYELNFRPDHKVINMATEMQLDELKEKIGETAVFAHAVPLPMIVGGYGPFLVHPETPEIGELFKPVGDVLYIENIEDIKTLQIFTCMMSPYYMLMQEMVQFSVDHGVEHDVSVKFAHSLFSSLTRRAAEDMPHHDLIELAHDMTPGGYNEQAMNELMENGAIKAWRTILDTLLVRLEAAKK